MANVPAALKYTKEHEWAKREGDRVRVGITHFAQEQLGDVVFVELPKAGTKVTSLKTFGVVESVKAVSDLYAPISGEVVETNAALTKTPELSTTIPTARAGCWSSRPRAGATGISSSPRSSTSSSWPTAATDALPAHHGAVPARHARRHRRARDRGSARQDPGQVPARSPAGPAARAGRDRVDQPHAGAGRHQCRQRQPRLFPRRRRLRPLRAEPDRSPGPSRRVLDCLHALSAG